VPLIRLAVLAAVAASIVLALKYGIGRHAPSGVQGPEAFRSYPSGHTATAVILWGTLYSVVAEYPRYAVSRQVAWLLSWLAPLMVMVGMVLRDYHWVTDLVAAAALCTVLLQAERLALGHWRGARRGWGSAARARAAAVGSAPGAG
jgi:undecaprenyl-diphosphatase